MEENMIQYEWRKFERDIKLLIYKIKDYPKKFRYVTGIPRGGLIPAVIISQRLDIEFKQFTEELFSIEGEILVIDEICDSGVTFKNLKNGYGKYKNNFTYASVYLRNVSKFKPDIYGVKIGAGLIIFPWE